MFIKIVPFFFVTLEKRKVWWTLLFFTLWAWCLFSLEWQ